MSPTERLAWRVAEAAQSLGISEKRVRGLIHDGTLGHIRAGTAYLIPDEELRRYVGAGVRP